MLYEKNDLALGLAELFKYAFVANCHLNDDCITDEDSKAIEEFDQIDLLENFKDLILNLLKFKKEFKGKDPTHANAYVIQCENELQNHQRIESELRIQLELSKIREEKLLKIYESASLRIKELESASSNQSESIFKWENLQLNLRERMKELSDKAEINEKNVKRLESENFRLRTMLEEKFIEIEILKKSVGKPKRSVGKVKDLKKHIEEKSEPLIHQKLREKSSSKSILRESNRENRRPSGLAEIPKPEKPLKCHHRSYSDQCKLII